jgi:hypothetical protein
LKKTARQGCFFMDDFDGEGISDYFTLVIFWPFNATPAINPFWSKIKA